MNKCYRLTPPVCISVKSHRVCFCFAFVGVLRQWMQISLVFNTQSKHQKKFVSQNIGSLHRLESSQEHWGLPYLAPHSSIQSSSVHYTDRRWLMGMLSCIYVSYIYIYIRCLSVSFIQKQLQFNWSIWSNEVLRALISMLSDLFLCSRLIILNINM